MSEQLHIDFKWLSLAQGSALERAFAAEIGIKLGEEWMTELQEFETRTTMTHLRACGHTLAMWFAANWWRLRWEPESRDAQSDVDWRIAHSMGSAGGGFAWPNIIFASDGESLALASIPRHRAASFEPLRYLNRIEGRITAAEFERKVDGFINAMISRQSSLSVDDSSLSELWKEVMDERSNPEATRWRKLEALCGYDTDEAPASIIESIIKESAELGIGALDEVAAESRHNTGQVLERILELAKSKKAPTTGGFRGKMPTLTSKPRTMVGERPWQIAAKLAQHARDQWGFGKKPISDNDLADLLETKAPVFSDRAKFSVTMPLALRTEANGSVDLYFNSAWSTTRRFATGRLIGDHLRYGNQGRLIAAADARTSRQQFQRAFAQEFLCPFNALQEKIQTEQPEDGDIAEAAAYFEVSPLMVKTTLVNKGELDREALRWSE